jgi:Flp pilus assembly protein TadG
MVELAMVMPLLLTIVLGIFYFGRYVNYSSSETHLAAEAVRWAAVNVNPGTSIQSYVRAQASPELLTTSTDVTSPVAVYVYYPTGSSGQVGNSVRACVIATVRLIPLLGTATSSTITQTATMRLEQAPSAWTPDTPPAACPLT